MDVQEDIKLEVCEAKEAPTEHPQWEFEDDEEESDSKDEESEDGFATDDDYDEDDDWEAFCRPHLQAQNLISTIC